MARLRNVVTVFLLTSACLIGAVPPTNAIAQTKPVAAVDAGEADAVAAWVSRHAIVLKTLDASRGLDDLKPLKQVLRNTRVVGLGEESHGAREIFQFKHRMIEFLVRELGFRVLAMEVSYPASLSINDYVLNGRGDRDKALADQELWAWDTEEVTSVIEWMRQYNRTAPEEKKVKFAGFDMHNSAQAIDVILDYLRKVAPQRVEATAAGLKALRPGGPGRQHFDYILVPAAAKAQTQTAINELMGFLSLNQARFSRLTSAQEFNATFEHARILAQFADVYGRPDVDKEHPENSRGAARDFYMAENIERAISADGPNARAIVWAHNEHIATSKQGMGSHLRQMYGPAYYAIGSSFNQGSFQAREMTKEATIGALAEFKVGPAQQGSIDWYLARTGMKTFMVDFRQAATDPLMSRWLKTTHRMRMIGLGFSYQWRDSMTSISIDGSFDGIAFIDQVTRARPNATGMRGPWVIGEKTQNSPQ